MNNLLHGTSKAIFYFFMACGLAIIAINVLAFTKVITPLIVLSGSMEPTIATGALIVASEVSAGVLQVGDIATFPRSDGILVTHRVISIEALRGSPLWTVMMKGDANDVADIDAYVQSTALKPIVIIPYLGSALAWISNNRKFLVAAAMVIAGIYLALKLIIDSRTKKASKEHELRKKRELAENENTAIQSNS